MVQRKAVNKLGIHSESKNHVISEKNQEFRNKGGGDLTKKMKKARSFKASDMDSLGRSLRRERLNKPSADSTQKKKPSPVKGSSSGSPNYMKPTSCSDARKDSLMQQVSHSSQTPDRNRGPKNSNYSKPSPVSALKKSVKVLKKSSSLKPVRPSMKKSSAGPALYPKMNVSRATCSSTLKDSKFPASVPLNPGATEAEGTSAMRVCPYSYCSLNGLHHVPLPPLKRFLSARRRLLKTQKSMKLKGLSSPRKKYHGERNQEIDTGQVLEADSDGSEICPLIKDEGLDFFVEIYAKPREEIGSDENSRAFDEISMVRDDEAGESLEGAEIEVKEHDGAAETEISFHVEDQNPSNLPCLIQEDNAETECCIGGNRGKEGESTAETEVGESVSEASDMDWEEEAVSFPDDKAEFYTSPDDELDLIAVSGVDDEAAFEQDGCVSGCNEAAFDAVQGEDGKDQSRTVDVPITDDNQASAASNTLIQNQNNAVLYLDYEQDETEFPGQNGDSTTEETEVSEASQIIDTTSIEGSIDDVVESTTESDEVMIENFGENGDSCQAWPLPREDEEGNADEPLCSFDVANETMPDELENSAPEPDPITDHVDFEQKHPDFAAEASESIVPEIDSGVGMSECRKDEVHPCVEIEDSTGEAELEGNLNMEKMDSSTNHATNAEVEISNCDEKPKEEQSNREAFTNQGRIKIDQSITSADHGSFDGVSNTITKDPIELGTSLISSSVLCHEGESSSAQGESSSAQGESSSAEDCSMINDKLQTEEKNQPDAIESCLALEEGETCRKYKITISRKRTKEESEEVRMFNPRPPRFLPVEPDPEAEKVDLKHQMMDERKNAEEWMVDYALRQAITKLAPARKKKVALLVEAFETVVPMPKFETHLTHSAATFTHARPIQACS